MSEQKLALIDGTYPSLMAGGVQCAQLYNNADLNDCVPENDKVFQAWVCTGGDISNTLSNTPFANFGRTFYLTAVKTWYNAQDNNKFRVVQTLYSVATGGVSQSWTRAIDGAGTLGWSDWKEIATSDGTYPNMGAGYLAKNIQVVAAANTAGWWKIGSIDVSKRGSTGSTSTILLCTGLYSHVQYSGIVEVNGGMQNGELNITASPLYLIAGGLPTDCLCLGYDGTVITLYQKLSVQYARFSWTILEDSIESTSNVDYFELGTSFYGTSAPEGAVYAVVRNNASYAESAGYLAKTVTVATTDNSAQYGWWRFARLPFSTLTSMTGTNSYSAILLVNSVNPPGISSTNAIQSGLIELELRLDGGEPTSINTNDVMKVLCGGISSDRFCCTVSDTEIEFYVHLNSAYNRRNFTVLNEVYYNGENVDALEFEPTFVSSSAPEGAVYAVVRNIASYAESIPVASESVFGGAKIYIDGDGYLNIDTQ